MFKVDDIIGVGIIATERIETGKIIEEIWGKTGRRINKKDADTHRSSIEDNTTNPSQFRLLNGPISFLNYSCLKHANCVTNFADNDQVYDFKVLQAVREIHPREELTICYSKFSHLSCRLCK
jgi:hypothetical protein